ncbi:UPF0481 protein [Prunus yedoensis var. nudiflora]|uniref:UPF0481 protein n=1 Tax=Prunus yedoensis var. nudiflora TaxID=2094558 RepID=A0A314YC32_PRUYE|nr:UPF0481 protein [Prunus yedoensis var. nudiflora]
MEDLDNLSALSPFRCIYRVPERLRHGNEKSYTPQVVSIGPLHHGKSHLNAMEEHKKRYLRDFLGRTQVSLNNYLSQIKGQEAKLRSYYAESIEFLSDKFVTIILVDAAFIIELLLRYGFPAFQDGNEYIFNEPWMIYDILPDLQMLENQLPFFILEDLFDPHKIFASTDDHPSIINLSYHFFRSSIYSEGIDDDLETRYFAEVEVQHFVDFIRTLCQPLDLKRGKLVIAPSITDLHRAGVKFRVGSTKNLFDIRFTDGVLEIPEIQIHDDTELIIRNLIAFEQCHCRNKYISDYSYIMDCFVNTKKDVAFLVKHGIVKHELGDSSRVSTLINKLGDGVVVDPRNFYFASICEDLNAYYGTTWHTWKANLRQNYLNTPWTIISVVAAVLLLLLTLIQTASSIVSIA